MTIYINWDSNLGSGDLRFTKVLITAGIDTTDSDISDYYTSDRKRLIIVEKRVFIQSNDDILRTAVTIGLLSY